MMSSQKFRESRTVQSSSSVRAFSAFILVFWFSVLVWHFVAGIAKLSASSLSGLWL